MTDKLHNVQRKPKHTFDYYKLIQMISITRMLTDSSLFKELILRSLILVK